ncbi:MAG: type IV pilus biogenesis/stability protein PilW [Betaproteobacteria bacterium]
MTRLIERLISAGVILAACGCAGTSGPDSSSYAPKTVVDTSELSRARIHTELAAGYMELGNYGVSLQEAGEALKADPNYAPAYSILGLVYMELRDDKAAEANFQRALRISPDDSDVNNNYGWFLCQRKREQESIKFFLVALRNPLYPTPDKSWVNAGICARQSGDLNGADDYFQKALKVRPGQPQALLQLADMAYKRKSYPEAKSYLMRIQRDVEPTPASLWLSLRVERATGDRNAEASLGFQLRKNFPESREARALAAGQYE